MCRLRDIPTHPVACCAPVPIPLPEPSASLLQGGGLAALALLYWVKGGGEAVCTGLEPFATGCNEPLLSFR